MKVGTEYLGDGKCSFTVWAPEKNTATVHIVSPKEQFLEMNKTKEGYFQLTVENIYPGATYFYRLDSGQDLPDPASHFQPEGVHGPSQVIDHSNYQWKDKVWKGIESKDMILYEMHLGTFTPEGTFNSMIDRLADLADTGINAIEIMPISQFPGNRNWGYDGVHPYSVQNSYGTPDDLRQLVDACHAHGIAVILDMVYNHLGPEGNYFGLFGPYFTDAYKTPGVRLSILTVTTRMAYGISLQKMLCSGFLPTTWMACVWMPFIPCTTMELSISGNILQKR
ncbi:alpha-amylase family glycosyl hydrolase [Rhodocytophaga rosea]|uniref:alpha-amylase family glycosyl hydrolase n=1 Tax=Rhodocytophaga rosea TaxID=2704465 RepID=UPI001E329664|nr:alpha-amylase family glycosyl hydrolase [Rhodocytophaga rosea]